MIKSGIGGEGTSLHEIKGDEVNLHAITSEKMFTFRARKGIPPKPDRRGGPSGLGREREKLMRSAVDLLPPFWRGARCQLRGEINHINIRRNYWAYGDVDLTRE